MPVDVVRNILITDLLSMQASSVQAVNTDKWADASEVPDYAYKSLKDIWVISSVSSSDWARRVVADKGEGREAAQGDITIYPFPYESAERRDGLQSNDPGAETTIMQIVLKLPKGSESSAKMKQALLRIRYLLDADWRRRRSKPSAPVSPAVPNNTDHSINGPVHINWIKDPIPIGAQEAASDFRVLYTRSVPKA